MSNIKLEAKVNEVDITNEQSNKIEGPNSKLDNIILKLNLINKPPYRDFQIDQVKDNIEKIDDDLFQKIVQQTFYSGNEDFFEYLLSTKSSFGEEAIDTLIYMIRHIDPFGKKNIIHYRLFCNFLSKIDKDTFYNVNLESLFSKICDSGLPWIFDELHNYIDFQQIKNIDGIIDIIINKIKKEEKSYSKMSSFLVEILLVFFKKNMTKHNKKIISFLADHSFEKTNFSIMLLTKFINTDSYTLFLKENLHFVINNIIFLYYKEYIGMDEHKKFLFLEFLKLQPFLKDFYDNSGYSIINYLVFELNFGLLLKLIENNCINISSLLDFLLYKSIDDFCPLDIISRIDKSDYLNDLLTLLHYVVDEKDIKFGPYKNILFNKDIEYSYKNLIEEHPKLEHIIESYKLSISKLKRHTLYTMESLAKVRKITEFSESDDQYKTMKMLINMETPDKNMKAIANNDNLKSNIDSLRKSFPNFKEFIDFVETNIYLNDLAETGFYIPPSLLIGSPGIGKTFFMYKLAEAVGIDKKIINMESVTAGFVLSGNTSQWSGSKQGLIFDHAMESKFGNSIFLLDEIDKIRKRNDHSPENILLSLLEKHTSKQFLDEYINIPIDVSKVSWICTANEKRDISAPILSRLNIFEIPDPTFNERIILTREIYFSILKDLNIKEKFNNNIDDKVITYICKNQSSNRDLKKILIRSISNAIKNGNNELSTNDIVLGSLLNNKTGLI